MATIRVLPDDLASQIAAGEVVERPASVIKELLENALDAEATRIEVRIVAGGLKELEIIDDGFGMVRQDAELCLLRHATSKLRQFSDLERLSSYGFRGEALPSITSVSELTLTTRPSGQDAATRISASFGQVRNVAAVGAPLGTSLRVQELFSNVPARLKFVRSTNTEAAHVTEVFTQVALSRPSVSFSLERDGRKVRHYPRVQDRKSRAAQIFDTDQFAVCEGARGPLTIEAYFSLNSSRSGAGGLRFLINGRAVRDRGLAGAVAHAYGEKLPRGHYPSGVVYLDLPPALVDINVHPQKLEVRFADPRAVNEALHSVVSRTLAQNDALSPDAAEAAPSPEAQRSSSRALRALRKESGSTEPQRRPLTERAPLARPAPVFAVAEPESLPKPVGGASAEPRPEPGGRADSSPSLDGPSSGRLRFLAQLQKTYLLAEGPDGIYFVDQQATAARALSQKLRRAFEEGSLRAQALLFPVTIALSDSEISTLSELSEELLRLGLDVRVRASQVVTLHSLPEPLKHIAPETLLQLVSHELSQGPSLTAKDRVFRAISALGSAFSLKTGEAVSAFAGQGLLNTLDDSAEGRRADSRILMRIGFEELERKLGPP